MFSSRSEQAEFEAVLRRDPTNLTNWLHFIELHVDEPWEERKAVFERVLAVLPASYKIWRMYLTELRQYCSSKKLTDPAFDEANAIHEKAFVFLHKVCKTVTFFYL